MRNQIVEVFCEGVWENLKRVEKGSLCFGFSGEWIRTCIS